MAECPKCKRPMRAGIHAYDYVSCWRTGDYECESVADAYQRGLLAGVELAKREVVLDQGNGWGAGGATIDWSDVDTEAAKMAGEG